jgi:uncharacterized cupredoxin-like copper-binding protein
VLRTGFTGFASRRAYLRLAAIILSVAAALSVAACGGDDDDDNGGSDQTAASTQATTGGGGGGGGETVQIGETEFALDPSEANVQAGEVTLEVEGQGVEEKTDLIEPGQSATLTVDLSQSGSYEMYCTVDSHREQGMEGEVTVQG